ncbi:MAG TPA: [FeFe] hydrogenase, group A [Bacteroidales bacterium]|nr:[FeFe] hydrogenase, group A [Bacteroidales bacterium]
MIFNIEVNNKTIKAQKGDTILMALKSNGIKVPTLCHMEDFKATGSCRMCVVEVEGKPNLIPACSYPVEEWMRIWTHSPKVIHARKTIVELLLSNHPDDCLYCERNGNCELQKLAIELNVRERRFPGKKNKYKTDPSSASIIRDPAKCILCGRCARVCEKTIGVSAIDFIGKGSKSIIGPAFNKGLNISSCINCGQCILVCPTGALYEKAHFAEIQDALHNPDLHVVIQYSPTVPITLAEEFGIKPGKDINGILNAVLRKIGFEKVFDTAFAVDLTVMEESDELIDRLQHGGKLPMFTSCCPGWIKYAEQFRPDFIENLSTCKSPQQMMGAVINSYYSQTNNIPSEKIYSVSVMPCTAKKFEAQREQMTHKGITDVDAVLTTRELARLIRLNGIDINQCEPETTDLPFRNRSSAGKIAGVSGGIMESMIRTLNYKLSGKELLNYKIQEIRGVKGRKEITIKIGEQKLVMAVINGLGNVRHLLDEIAAGRNDIQFVEVMACPGGCINGGGQPLTKDTSILKIRAKAIYEIDETEALRVAHKNASVNELYANFLNVEKEDNNHELLHTSYKKREVLL